jgi:hypothetical protein
MKARFRQIRRAPRLWAAVSLLIVGGCSGGSSLGDVDTVFLSAAGSWDTNRDGVVTCYEWKQYAAELYNGADSNGDGTLDRTEYVKIINTDRMFQTVEFGYYDTDKDGKLTRAEFVERPNRAFVLLDKNNECKLAASQVAGARARTEKVYDTKKPESGDPREKNTPGMP